MKQISDIERIALVNQVLHTNLWDIGVLPMELAEAAYYLGLKRAEEKA